MSEALHSASPLAYVAEEKMLLAALESNKGVRIYYRNLPPFHANKRCTALAQKLNAVRKRDRKNSLTLYPEDDPRRGRSNYDALEIRVIRDEVAPYVEVLSDSARLAEVTIEDIL